MISNLAAPLFRGSPVAQTSKSLCSRRLPSSSTGTCTSAPFTRSRSFSPAQSRLKLKLLCTCTCGAHEDSHSQRSTTGQEWNDSDADDHVVTSFAFGSSSIKEPHADGSSRGHGSTDSLSALDGSTGVDAGIGNDHQDQPPTAASVQEVMPSQTAQISSENVVTTGRGFWSHGSCLTTT